MATPKYGARSFSIPAIPGISEKQIEEHLKLYQGYVTHVNKIYDELDALAQDAAQNAHLMQELRRRLGFEFNGMRLHEYYFGDLEHGPSPLPEGVLSSALTETFGGLDQLKTAMKSVIARGSGWAIMNYDPDAKRLHLNWVTNHDEGQMATLPAIVALDCWEHAYMVDYTPGDKGKYFDAYLAAIDWKSVSKRFDSVA